MRVFHRTTPEAAKLIRETGEFISREAGGPVYVSNRRNGQAVGYGVAVVRLNVPVWALELDDEFPGGEKHFRIIKGFIDPEWISR